ncbi:MAG: ATP-binding protein [Fusobacteriaceae bacterium]
MELNFSSTGRMILQLGEQLIKNEIIALSELVKNAYDADATKCELIFQANESEEIEKIIILDNGEGMTRETIINSWFVIGGDYKKQKIKSGKTSKKYNRLPIGEKGIGRLGLSKLGICCSVFTKNIETGIEYSFSMDWEKFETSSGLKDVVFDLKENKTNEIIANSGTKLVITKLKNNWSKINQKKIIRDLRTLSSPFGGIENFKIVIKVPDMTIFSDIKGIDDIINLALYRAKFVIENNFITELEYKFSPYDYMTKLKLKKLNFNNIPLEFKAKDEVFRYDLRKITNLNRIEGEVLIYDKAPNILNKLKSSERSGIKDVLKHLGGIKVYRDGNRVYNYGSEGDDWLSMDRERINTPASKLGNDIIIGSIKLRREETLALEEKTNREGFLENDAFYVFKNVIRVALKEIEKLRNEDKNIMREIYDKSPVQEPVIGEIKKMKDIIEKDSRIQEVTKKKLKIQLVLIEKEYIETTNLLTRASGMGLSLSVVVHELDKRIRELNLRISESNIEPGLKNLSESLSKMISGYQDLMRNKKMKNTKIKNLINESLENVMYRLKLHNFIIDDNFNKREELIVKMSESLMIGNIINIIDNSMYWVEKVFKIKEKKILIDYFTYGEEVNLLIADNGRGFTISESDAIKPLVTGKDAIGIGLGLYIANETMKEQRGILSFPTLKELRDIEFNLPKEYEEGAKIMFSFKQGEVK